MTKLKNTPAAEPSAVELAERALAERMAELATIRGDIAAAEAALPALALDPDDAKFEETSLNIDRLKRSEMRATKRVSAVEVQLAEAEAREKQARRLALYSEGKKAAAEVERLAEEYAEHATKVADTFRAIDKLREPIEVANAALPEGKQQIDVGYALRLNCYVELPAAAPDGAEFWRRSHQWKLGPLDQKFETKFQPVARHDLIVQRAHQPVPQETKKYGEHALPDGSRKIILPPNEWPPRPDSANA